MLTGEFREQLCDHSTWLIAECLLLIEILQISILETTLLDRMFLGAVMEQSPDVHTRADRVMRVCTCAVYSLAGCFPYSVNRTAKLVRSSCL